MVYQHSFWRKPNCQQKYCENFNTPEENSRMNVFLTWRVDSIFTIRKNLFLFLQSGKKRLDSIFTIRKNLTWRVVSIITIKIFQELILFLQSGVVSYVDDDSLYFLQYANAKKTCTDILSYICSTNFFWRQPCFSSIPSKLIPLSCYLKTTDTMRIACRPQTLCHYLGSNAATTRISHRTLYNLPRWNFENKNAIEKMGAPSAQGGWEAAARVNICITRIKIFVA